MESNDFGKEVMTDHKKEKLQSFGKEDISKSLHATVFLGDSLTEGYPIEEFYPELSVVNRGIGGDTIGGVRHQGVYNRLQSTVYNLLPNRIILMIGFNDIAYSTDTPFELKLLQYEYLIWKIRSDLPDTELWTISVLPARGQFASKNSEIKQYNMGVEKIAKKYGAFWLNVFDAFLDPKGELKEEYATDDVHLSESGYKLLTRLYRINIFDKKSAVPAGKHKMARRRSLAGLFRDECVASATDEERNQTDDDLQPASLCFPAGTADKKCSSKSLPAKSL